MKKNLAKNAEQIAKHGRYGDDRLLHVSQAEIDGLASLLPGGKLPHNPETGLPEAFFFLPFLASLGAAAAPAAAGLGAAAATAIPAALSAAAPAAASTLGAAGAAGATGLMAAAAPTAATMGAAAAPAAAGLTAGTAGATGAALGAGTAGATGLGSLGAGTAATALPNAVTGASAGFGSTVPSIAAPTAATGLVPPTTASSGLASLAPAASGVGSGVMPSVGASGTANLAAPAATTAAPASSAPGLASSMPNMGAEVSGAISATKAVPDLAATMSQSPGGLGSLMGGMDMNKLLQYGAMAAMMMPQGGGGGDDEDEGPDVDAKKYDPGETATPSDGGASGGLSPEFDFFPGSRYYAEGGIASLGGDGQELDDDTLIDATVAAIQGQTPNADAIVQMFIQRFGPEALQDLLTQVGATQQNSDGMSDSVPAMINGPGQTAPAQISEGEYIIPADAVSGLGNGSTMAGARQLDDMVKRTREMRGMPEEPRGISALQAMPV